ncbi:Protein TIC 214 [Rhizoctonia solani]|uniref:Protein TIC 214 n=1 Tax=Rhizoctonia solani TaxID=456999 RepID=A0A0K6GAX1_9AGAM|nr:Protein TIC 214 [Rhizoctonia solani]
MSSEKQNQPVVPRIHGLIIAVNRYKRSDVHPDLKGCVGDAQSMFKYFTDLGVPENRLLCLYDEHATRDAILSAFLNHLINNPDIKPFDPIVVYFAGYGDWMPAPKSWQNTDGVVGLLLPHDATTIDEKQCYKHGIPDPTFAFLLYKLSQEKGNNITIILDSCRSAGSSTHGGVRSRSSHDPNAPPIPDNLDLELRKSLSVDYPTKAEHEFTSKHSSTSFMPPSLETHILLAAYQSEERTQQITSKDPNMGDIMERKASGVFTTALLEELRKCDLTTTSYVSLIRSLLSAQSGASQSVRSQTFRGGRNQDRLLFSVQNSILKRGMGVVETSEKGVYRVNIGSIQGVVPGTEFGVFYPTDPWPYASGQTDSTSTPRMILTATDVGPTISQLRDLRSNGPPEIPMNAYVTILRYNDRSNWVRIWVDESVRRDEFWQDVFTSLDSLPILWVTLRENHDLELFLSNGDIEFRGAQFSGQFGSPHILKRTIQRGRLLKILTSIICFHFYLKDHNKQAPVRDKLGIMLRELEEEENSQSGPVYEAKGQDLFGDSVPVGTVATIYADPSRVFGLELTNNSTDDLFPYVLYYDFEDYSVGSLYEPSRSKAPLRAGKSLTIGYGYSSSQPFQVDFTNPKSEKEYGAFVLLVSNKWVGLPYLRRFSPLAVDAFEGERSTHHSMFRPGDWDGPVWDRLVVRVETVRRT